jgi:hypothetical protein
MNRFPRLVGLFPAKIGAAAASLLLVSAVCFGSDDPKKKPANNAPAPVHQQATPQQAAPPAARQQAPPPVVHQQPSPQTTRQPAPPPQPMRQLAPPPQPIRQPGMPPANNGGNNRPNQPPVGPTPGQRLAPQGQPLPGQGQQFGRRPEQSGPGPSVARDPAPRVGLGVNHPTYAPRTGVPVTHGPGGRDVVHSPNGSQVHVVGGRVAEVHTSNGAIIHHAPDGRTHVEMVRPGGRVVVVSARGNGYVQRPVMVGGRTYVQRTYVVHGVVVPRVYRTYAYRPGLVLNVYAPMRYYRPGFYMYAYNPWNRPVVYSSWGWGGSPWYGYYGGYFAPEPMYRSPAFWLTDYMIAATLDQAYQDRMASNQSMQAGYVPSGPGLSPDVKQLVADEVSRQLHQEQAEAQSPAATANANPFGGDAPHVFVANASVEAVSGDQTCVISEGDVLELRGAPPLDATAASVQVRASKGGCPRGATVMVGLQELAEMQNHMRELIDRGLGDLQTKQGQGGLPPLSADAAAPATPVSWASQITPDSGVLGELTQVSDEATRAEQEAVNGALNTSISSSASGAGPREVGLGSTIDDVLAIFGQPLKTADLGPKKIYIYKDVKITFQDGKVIDVQ